MHVERVLRVLTLTVVAFAAWIAARPERSPSADQASGTGLGEVLERWTTTPPERAHVSLESAPAGVERDWLRAIRRTGTPLTWTDNEIPPLAIEVAPVVNPRGGATVWLTAASGAPVSVSDGIALLDTVVARDGGAMLRAAITVGPYVATSGAQRAVAHVRDTILPRRVLVLGRATWEAKFVITALEEGGWPVEARLVIAPGVEVTQGTPGQPDTARHAAVVVLDAPPAGPSAAVARYARAGGGVVLSGASARAPVLSAIAPGRVGARTRASSLVFAEDGPRRALGFLAIVPGGDALVVEEQGEGGRVAVAARRAESGRVVQVGYDESWRWRLGGGASAVEAHRAWWSSLVSGVAYRSAVPLPVTAPHDPAPRAALVEALGPASPPADERGGRGGWTPPLALLFALIGAFLLAEIASRRLRGAA